MVFKYTNFNGYINVAFSNLIFFVMIFSQDKYTIFYDEQLILHLINK
jgi:hypothetical protein